jgi:peptidoglycan/LPS O-acetylase OafA/YrhL
LGIGPLLTVSGISYSLYLLHNNLGCVLIHHLNSWGLPSNLAFGVTCVLSIALAWLITHYFERPVSQYLRGRWRGRRRQPALSSSVPTSDSMSVTSR